MSGRMALARARRKVQALRAIVPQPAGGCIRTTGGIGAQPEAQAVSVPDGSGSEAQAARLELDALSRQGILQPRRPSPPQTFPIYCAANSCSTSDDAPLLTLPPPLYM